MFQSWTSNKDLKCFDVFRCFLFRRNKEVFLCEKEKQQHNTFPEISIYRCETICHIHMVIPDKTYAVTEVTQNNTSIYTKESSQNTSEITNNNLDAKFERTHQNYHLHALTCYFTDSRTR